MAVKVDPCSTASPAHASGGSLLSSVRRERLLPAVHVDRAAEFYDFSIFILDNIITLDDVSIFERFLYREPDGRSLYRFLHEVVAFYIDLSRSYSASRASVFVVFSLKFVNKTLGPVLVRP